MVADRLPMGNTIASDQGQVTTTKPTRNEIGIKGMKCRTYLFANANSSSVFFCKKGTMIEENNNIPKLESAEELAW